jgi:hypothetical protein
MNREPSDLESVVFWMVVFYTAYTFTKVFHEGLALL